MFSVIIPISGNSSSSVGMEAYGIIFWILLKKFISYTNALTLRLDVSFRSNTSYKNGFQWTKFCSFSIKKEAVYFFNF